MWLDPCVLGFFTTSNSPCGGTLMPQTPRSVSLPPGPGNPVLGNGALPPPVGGTIALSSQARYSGTTLSRGGALGVEGKSLAQWPLFLQGSAGHVPRSAPPTPASPAAEGMRSASRGLQIPGVGGARPAPALCPPPALAHPPAVCLRCLGDHDFRAGPGPQGAPPSGGEAWAGRPGVPGSCSGSLSAAAGLSHRSPPAATPHNGGEQLAGGGAEENPEPAGAGGRRGGARGQPAARAGLREEAEGDRKEPTPRPQAPPPQWAPPRAAGPSGAHLPCPHAPRRTWRTWAGGVGLWGGALPVLCPSRLPG